MSEHGLDNARKLAEQRATEIKEQWKAALLPEIRAELQAAILAKVEGKKISEGLFTPFDEQQRREVEIYNRGILDALQAIREVTL